MKRDPDLIRAMCFALEELKADEWLEELEGTDDAVFAYHAQLMIEAGLAKGLVHDSLDGVDGASLQRLTSAGHDFADAARSDTLWSKAKGSVLRPGASWTFDLLKEWLKTEISQGFSTFRGQS